MARWAEYFEQLFKANPPSRQLQTTGLQEMDDPPVNEAELRSGKDSWHL